MKELIHENFKIRLQLSEMTLSAIVSLICGLSRPLYNFQLFCEKIANGNNTLLLSIYTHSHIIIITCVLGLLHSFSRKR